MTKYNTLIIEQIMSNESDESMNEWIVEGRFEFNVKHNTGVIGTFFLLIMNIFHKHFVANLYISKADGQINQIKT